VYSGQTVGWIKTKLGTEVGLGAGDTVRVTWEPSSPKRRIAPNFRPMSVVAKRLDRLRCHLVRGRHRPRRHCVRPRWGRSSPKREWGHSPNFQPIYLLRPNGWMDQDAIWYGGRPRPRRHCVRQGSGPLKNQHGGPDSSLTSPSKKGHGPNFRPYVCCGQTAGWIKMPLSTEVGRPRPRPHCVRRGPSPPPEKEAQQGPVFRPCLLWPNARPSQLLLSSC